MLTRDRDREPARYFTTKCFGVQTKIQIQTIARRAAQIMRDYNEISVDSKHFENATKQAASAAQVEKNTYCHKLTLIA